MGRAGNVASNSWSIVKSELRLFVGTFWRGFWRTGLVVAVGLALFFAYAIATQEPPEGAPAEESGALDFAILFVIAFFYALYVAFFPAVVAGIFWLAWKMAGPWILVPLVFIPLCVWLSLWAMGGVMAGEADELIAALGTAAGEHDWVTLKLGTAARAGPVILVIAIPLLIIDFGAILLTPSVLWALLTLVLWTAFAFALGFVPSAGFSLVVVTAAWVRRFLRRHREELETIGEASETA